MIFHAQSHDLCLDSIIFLALFDLISSSPKNHYSYFQSGDLAKLGSIPYPQFFLIIYNPMFFPSPSAWNMVRVAPNHIPENMLG